MLQFLQVNTEGDGFSNKNVVTWNVGILCLRWILNSKYKSLFTKLTRFVQLYIPRIVTFVGWLASESLSN
ncbi:unnamed protein product [Victoria cruziana]